LLGILHIGGEMMEYCHCQSFILVTHPLLVVVSTTCLELWLLLTSQDCSSHSSLGGVPRIDDLLMFVSFKIVHELAVSIIETT